MKSFSGSHTAPSENKTLTVLSRPSVLSTLPTKPPDAGCALSGHMLRGASTKRPPAFFISRGGAAGAASKSGLLLRISPVLILGVSLVWPGASSQAEGSVDIIKIMMISRFP
eukprot:1226294-Prymnesium_polylepis.1